MASSVKPLRQLLKMADRMRELARQSVLPGYAEKLESCARALEIEAVGSVCLSTVRRSSRQACVTTTFRPSQKNRAVPS
jgi:hypothetical protein